MAEYVEFLLLEEFLKVSYKYHISKILIAIIGAQQSHDLIEPKEIELSFCLKFPKKVLGVGEKSGECTSQACFNYFQKCDHASVTVLERH